MGTIPQSAGDGLSRSQIKSHFQGAVHFEELGGGEGANVVRKIRFAQTDEIVTHDPARMLQSFFKIDGDLRG